MPARAAPLKVLPPAVAVLATVLVVGVSMGRPPAPVQLDGVLRPVVAPSAALTNDAERRDLSVADQRRVTAVVRPTTDFSRAEAFEVMAGGAGTSTARIDKHALSHAASTLNGDEEQRFRLGSALFEKLWVSSPSSTQASDGLGPLYNARACATCHVGDGRGHPPDAGASSPSLVLKLTAFGPSGDGPPTGDPVYGRQLQDSAVPGLPAEGHLALRTAPVAVSLAGGEVVTLRRPTYAIERLGYGPLDAATGLSPRLAPSLSGLGLLEAIHPADVLAHADPDDRDGDGIRGRPSLVRDEHGAVVLGRFGWKAEAPSVRAQAAAAFALDLGISTPDVMASHGDCTARQPACLAMEDGVQPRLGASEAPDPVLDLVAFYARHLAVPARRNVAAPEVLAGKRLFSQAGCAACHVPKYVTRRDAPLPSERFQLIWPYTDLLLHDMGEGLADAVPATWHATGSAKPTPSAGAPAGAREWRTPPLWGIGLAQQVDPRAGFLHDGRARTLAEAVLWHGGEAEAARDRFVSLDASDRRALIAFLESL